MRARGRGEERERFCQEAFICFVPILTEGANIFWPQIPQRGLTKVKSALIKTLIIQGELSASLLSPFPNFIGTLKGVIGPLRCLKEHGCATLAERVAQGGRTIATKSYPCYTLLSQLQLFSSIKPDNITFDFPS